MGGRWGGCQVLGRAGMGTQGPRFQGCLRGWGLVDQVRAGEGGNGAPTQKGNRCILAPGPLGLRVEMDRAALKRGRHGALVFPCGRPATASPAPIPTTSCSLFF